MSPLLRRGFALFLLLLAASLLHPVDTTAQNLPGWAEPSEQRQSRFESRDLGQTRHHLRKNGARPDPSRVPGGHRFPGAVTFNQGGGNNQCTAEREPCGKNGNKVCVLNAGGKFQCVPKNSNPGQEVPVDDYLPLLMLAGIAYAALRLRQ
jgi:hypothetical protein